MGFYLHALCAFCRFLLFPLFIPWFHHIFGNERNWFPSMFFCQQSYEVPIAMKAVLNYVDTFSSRIREMEQQKRDGVVCKKEDKPRSLENFIAR